MKSISKIIQKKNFFLLLEAKEYLQSLRVNIGTHKSDKTLKKIQLNVTKHKEITILNKEAFTNAIDNMVNYCEEILMKEAPRKLCK